MTATATAAVVRERGDRFHLEEVRLAPMRPEEVLVRLVATGICHTDISAARGVIPFPLPAVLGHEGSGVVERVGDRVTRTAVGDRVLLTFTSCGRCAGCRSGHPAYCLDHLRLNLLGGRRADGSATVSGGDGVELNAHFFGQSSFATRAIVDERGIVVLPADTTDAELVTLAPLGCGLQTGAGAVLNELRPRPGAVLAVTGAGAVGLAGVMAAQMTPAASVIAVDRVPDRLRLARELGADAVVDASATSVTEALHDITGGRGVDLVLETTGNTAVLESAVASLAVRGQCAVVGAPAAGARASFAVNELLPGRVVRGVTLGDSEPERFVPELVRAHRAGRFPFDRLARTYPFAEIDRAVTDTTTGAVVKPVLTFEDR